MHFCGPCHGPGVAHGTINACFYEPTAGVILLALAVLQAVWQIRRLRLLERYRFEPSSQTASGHVGLALYAALAATHSFTFIFELATDGGPPFAALYDATLLSAWGVALVAAWLSWKHRVAVRWRLQTCLAAAVYAGSLYIASRALRAGRPAGPPPALPSARLHVILSAVQLALAVAAAAADFMRPSPPAEEEEALKQALLGSLNENGEAGHDVENPAPKKGRSWYSLFGSALVFVWPDDWVLQARGIACVVIIGAVRLLNLAVPILYKKVVDTLADITQGTHPRPGDLPQHYTFMQAFYPYVLLYIAAYFFQGGTGGGSVGLLSNLRQYLWIPITQNAYRRISLDLFTHMLELDLNFHLHRKTGEVMRILDRGTSAIQNILSTVIFAIGPQIIDIILSCCYIAYSLEAWIAVIVFITLASYIPLTIWLTEWRGQFRRDLNRLDNAKGAKATDALLNYETVSYFCNQKLERDNFATAISDYQTVEYKLLASLNILNVAQSLIIFTGLAAGLTVCAKGVASGSLTVGDAVLFVTLIQQLYAPLNYFGTYYRTIQQYMIDMENMFDLLATNPQLQDAPDAKALVHDGAPDIAFESCSFEYSQGTPVLRGVSMATPGGRTMALVGATGSGKSTCLRLLFRFYDATGGRVTINGQDISKVTQASLRAAIGVVPQDTVLFNDTILYNIRYGRPSATDEEVYEAARAASIHEAIETRFPQGYATVVGERGLRLSGGEKQRVAFARTILKDPAVLLLDEATSSLDSLTERRIQEALTSLRQDRTTVIVAHRLSTIMDADQIVVLQHGEIAEMGRHAELLEKQGGVYADMWKRQQEAAAVDGAGSAATSRAASRVASMADLQSSTETGAQKAAPKGHAHGS